MAYDDNELSARGGMPRELYRFTGTYAVYRYTSGSKAIKWQAPDENEEHTYAPITLNRSEVTAGTPEDDGTDLTVDLPVDCALVQAYLFTTSPPDLDLTAWRYHTLDAVVPYWTGRITNINVQDEIATLTSPSELARAMAQEFPNVYFQSPCNHVLYDGRCKVKYEDWSTTATITAVDDNVISVTAEAMLKGKLADALVGGEFVLPSGERRMIVRQEVIPAVAASQGQPAVAEHVDISINFPFAAANVGTEVTIAAGCNYAYSGDCAAKFDNQINFGGFPFLPPDNIFETGVDPGQTLPDNTCLPQCDPTVHRLKFYSTNPCNPNWDGSRYILFPETRPNGGKAVNAIQPIAGGQPWVFELFENNDPETDPAWYGQPLLKWTQTDFNTWEAEIYFEVNPGEWRIGVFPSARFCGSVGKDGGNFILEYYHRGVMMFRQEQGAAGNTQYEWRFEG